MTDPAQRWRAAAVAEGATTFFRYRTGATPTLADGERTRIAPQFYYYVGSFGLLGEYTQVSQDVSRATPSGLRDASFDTTAWQLAASWFLTGAFELVGRYHELSIDDAAFVGGADSFADPAVSARQATAWALGVNWYLNESLKWVLNYERTRFEGGAAGGADRENEEAFLTRVALGF